MNNNLPNDRIINIFKYLDLNFYDDDIISKVSDVFITSNKRLILSDIVK